MEYIPKKDLNDKELKEYNEADEAAALENTRNVGQRLLKFQKNYYDSVGGNNGEVGPKGLENIDPYGNFDKNECRVNLREIVSTEKLAEGIKSSPETKYSGDEQVLTAVKKMIAESFVESARECNEIKKEITRSRLAYKASVEDAAEISGEKSVFTRNQYTDETLKRYQDSLDKLTKLARKNPESWVAVNGYDLRDRIKEVHSGGIIMTPSVRKNFDRIAANMESGTPTFVHGPLGSGKTELAIQAAKKTAIERQAYALASIELKLYEAENPEASEEERLEQLGYYFDSHKNKFEKDLAKGNKKAVDKFTPLVISGSSDLTIKDLYTDKVLSLKQSDVKTIQEESKRIEEELNAWISENPEVAKDNNQVKLAQDRIIAAFKKEDSAFGTITENVEKEILRGVQEGRPVIIDEANAIPSSVFISLNDILQKRPGQTCYIPGKGTVKIKEGFSITATGNLETGRDFRYFGTQEINAATMSRFNVINHGYMPMSTSDSLEKQESPQNNELFSVLVSYLADEKGNLVLPDIENTLSQIFRLSQLAAKTQEIFEGKLQKSDVLKTSSGDELEPKLKRSVLSVRNVINVLKEWNKGQKCSLDNALWDGFIAQITEPNDQNMTIQLAKFYNFFQEKDGWNIRYKGIGEGLTSKADIYREGERYIPEPLEVYDLRKVVDLLYGEAPERDFYPVITLSDFENTENPGERAATTEDSAEFKEIQKELEESIAALEVLYDQCGCSSDIKVG